MRLILIALFLLASCGRPLTPNETAFLRAIQGEQIDTARIRFHDGLAAGSVTYRRPIRPRLSCMERIWPPSRGETVTVSPGAMTLFHRVFYRKDLYRDDFLPDYPARIDLLDAMLLAHEAVDLGEKNNPARTGYTPIKAMTEHGASNDPYLFDPDGTARFLDHGYEQQGAVVEEYVCCHVLDPGAPRTERLRRMIGAEMPIARLNAALDNPEVVVPWAGLRQDGICR